LSIFRKEKNMENLEDIRKLFNKYDHHALDLHFGTTPKRVIFNPPATIVFWTDGTKTVVKCSADDEFDKYRGFTMAYLKKSLGSGKKSERFINDNFKNTVKVFSVDLWLKALGEYAYDKEFIDSCKKGWAIDGTPQEHFKKMGYFMPDYWFEEREMK